MLSLEQEIKAYLNKHSIRFDEGCDEFDRLDAFPDIFQNTLECYGSYIGEKIGSGGIIRRPEHWKQDVSSTR